MLSLFSCLIGRAIGDGHLDRDAPCLLLPQEAQRGVHPSRVIKERCRLGLGPWHLALRIGYVEHKVQRPTQQLGECPDRPGKAKRLETPHAQGVGVAHDLLIIAIGAFTATASSIEVMPRLGAALDRTNEARMVFETHAVRVAQDAVAVWAALLLLGRTLEATDILPALCLVVVAIGVT